MSFATEAALVRDPAAPLDTRVLGLKHCIAEFKPLGYKATLSYLETRTGASDRGWTHLELIAAIELLDTERRRWHAFAAEWASRRRMSKAAGQRDVPAEERALLDAKPWLAWTRTPAAPGAAPPETPSADPPRSFPGAHGADFAAVRAIMPPAQFGSQHTFEVMIDGERFGIPTRIYNPEPTISLSRLPPTQRVMAHCLYTRHNDGHVRQRHLAEILGVGRPWVVPYVVALVGDYVVEIVEDIQSGLNGVDVQGTWKQHLYGRFVLDNPEFFQLTRQRVASYWNEYYRREFTQRRPDRSVSGMPRYPGFDVIDGLTRAARRPVRLSPTQNPPTVSAARHPPIAVHPAPRSE